MAVNGHKGVEASDSTMRRLAIVGFAGLVACVVVRAPTMLPSATEVPLLKVKLALNAGHVLVFAPLAVTVGLAYAVLRLARRSDIHPVLAVVAFLLPPLSVAFLSLQFFLLLAPSGQCATFARLRLLFDRSIETFQPEYCMGVAEGVQGKMPYLIAPPIVEAWFQALLPVAALLLALWGWRRWTASPPV